MKIWLIHNGTRARCTLPMEGARYVVVDIPCKCGKRPALVRGHDVIREFDLYVSRRTVTQCCGSDLGQLVIEIPTACEVEADGRVHHGRARVHP